MTSGVKCTLEELIMLRSDAQHMSFSARKISQAKQIGRKNSRFRGRGMDYFESRAYVEGDDVRHIDWRVTARTGALHSKLYVEERERPVLIVGDFSPSMYFGTRTALKSVAAARMAALMAWYCNLQGDRVGGLLFTPEQEVDIRPATGKQSVLNLMSALADATQLVASKPSGSESYLPKALDHAAKVVRPGSLVLFISDFYAAESEEHHDDLRRSLHHLAAHSDVIGFYVSDPIEHQLPANSRSLRNIPMSNRSGKQRLRVSTANQRLGRSIADHYQCRAKWLEREFGQLGLPVIPLSTTDRAIDAIHRPTRLVAA